MAFDPDLGAEVATLAVDILGARGIRAGVGGSDDGIFIGDLEGTLAIPLDLLIEAVGDTEPATWPALEAWIDRGLQLSSAPKPQEMPVEELRRRIRVHVRPDEPDRVDGLVWRPIAAGLAEVLCVDYPEAVMMLKQETLAELQLGVDELFELGRANTLAEPVDEVTSITEGVGAVFGDSHFVAAHAVGLETLVGDVISAAPCGVAFAVPNRHSLLFSVITPDGWAAELITLTQVLSATLEYPEDHPGGIISDAVYYWAPDGRVERVTGAPMLVEGSPTEVVRLTPALADYVQSGKRNSG